MIAPLIDDYHHVSKICRSALGAAANTAIVLTLTLSGADSPGDRAESKCDNGDTCFIAFTLFDHFRRVNRPYMLMHDRAYGFVIARKYCLIISRFLHNIFFLYLHWRTAELLCILLPDSGVHGCAASFVSIVLALKRESNGSNEAWLSGIYYNIARLLTGCYIYHLYFICHLFI